jgi:hypothetical protein
MGKFLWRSKEVARITVRAPAAGSRAVFLVEADGRRERRQVRELFETVAELADVTPLAEGQIMAYAVQVRGDTSLFAKIEWLLKSQFAFSVVERSFSEITYRLIESLCQESESRILRVPRCGICDAADPFPTRVTMRDEQDEAIVEATYCGPCAARQADRDRKKALIELLAADRRNFAAIRQARLVRTRRAACRPRDAHGEEVQTYAIAS